MDLLKKYTKRCTFWLFKNEYENVEKIVLHARDTENWEKKYESVSHFFRCAVVKLINKERYILEAKRGRPKK